MPRASIDCSLLAHALIPAQQTDEGVAALNRLLSGGWEMFATPALFLEFSGLILKLGNQQVMSRELTSQLYANLTDLPLKIVPFTPALFARAWEVARGLGQSDTFDALGYAAAEAVDAEFWTSDARFRNAAANRRLPRITFVP